MEGMGVFRVWKRWINDEADDVVNYFLVSLMIMSEIQPMIPWKKAD